VSLLDIIDFDEPFDDLDTHVKRMEMMPDKTRTYFQNEARKPKMVIGAGFVRTRASVPTLEVRVDGLAGCVRTGSGGSNRQVLVVAGHNTFLSRHFTPREEARLQGFPDDYELPRKLVARRTLVGDAVCIPVVRHLAEQALAPLLRKV
jgi:DNA (cytosine-5)-methyltransferase 1